MALEGTLNYLDITHLFQVVGGAQKSGVLTITWEDRRAKILFARGRLTNAESNRFRKGIGSLLVDAGYLTQEDLEKALQLQRAEGTPARRLGAILCDEFGVKPQDIERQLRRQFQLIVFDVFSWPGGRFVFEFQEPMSSRDRFHVDPVEFILSVGIEAGLLAEEGIEREKAGRESRHMLFLVEEPSLLSRCREHWQRKGFWVTCCDAERDLVGYLGEYGDNPPVVVVSEAVRAPGGGLAVIKAMKAKHPAVAAVLLGARAPDLQLRATEVGALGAVEVPSPEDLAGEMADAHLRTFLSALEAVVTSVRERALPADRGAIS